MEIENFNDQIAFIQTNFIMNARHLNQLFLLLTQIKKLEKWIDFIVYRFSFI